MRYIPWSIFFLVILLTGCVEVENNSTDDDNPATGGTTDPGNASAGTGGEGADTGIDNQNVDASTPNKVLDGEIMDKGDAAEPEATVEPQPPTCIEVDGDRVDEVTVWNNHIDDPLIADYCVRKTLVVEDELTIEPGVRVEVDGNKKIKINDSGAIIAIGTEDEPIVFTGSVEETGYWEGIVIISDDPRNELTYTDIGYAGGADEGPYTVKANILLEDGGSAKGRLNLRNSRIHHSDGYGLAAKSLCVIESFESNQFAANKDAPISIRFDQLTKLDEQTHYGDDNGMNVIRTSGLWVEGPEEHRWRKPVDDTPILFTEDCGVRTGLTIDPGVVMLFELDTSFIVMSDGYLSAIGTEEQPIRFTGSVTNAPSWRGIAMMSNDPRNEISYAEISYGGSLEHDDPYYVVPADIFVGNSSTPNIAQATIKNCTISNSGGWGIATDQYSSFVEEDNTFENNASGDVYSGGE